VASEISFLFWIRFLALGLVEARFAAERLILAVFHFFVFGFLVHIQCFCGIVLVVLGTYL
jgi:hypothetical protein